MGNSLGGLESYMRLLNDFEQYQGGFIWDYMDQALWHTDAAGRRALGYGGDFGERATNYNFSGNGIVYADGKEKPAMQDVRYWFADEASRTAHDARNAEAAAQADRELAAVRAARRKAPLTVVEGDGEVGVKGKNFEVLFSYGEAGLSSLKIDGYEWMWRAPRPAFSALPNTAQEIEAAQHIEELPVTGRTSVTVLGAVRGVGGIDSWGTDVEEPYRISGAQDHSVVFRIVL